jgi:hypothetical protein
LIKLVESHTMSGPAGRQLRSPALQRVLRAAWEEQRRFPLKLATTLSQQFASRGLQFFKVNRTVTHVSVARPHFLDMDATPVSQGVRQIVDFINATPKCTRRKLIECLAPAARPPAPTPPPAAGVAPAPAPETSPEQTAVASDLHWLIHEGHVIEFANGILETAKKPFIKPPRPEPKTTAPAAPAKEQAPGGQTAAAPETAIPAAGGEASLPAAAGETPAPAPGADAAGSVAPAAQPAMAPPGEAAPESAIRPEESGQSAIPTPGEPPPEPSAAPQSEALPASPLNAP